MEFKQCNKGSIYKTITSMMYVAYNSCQCRKCKCKASHKMCLRYVDEKLKELSFQAFKQNLYIARFFCTKKLKQTNITLKYCTKHRKNRET